MATLVRWDPFREIGSLQDDMQRLMRSLVGGEANGQSSRTWVPAVDVWETENELVYAFDLPGIEKEKVSVEIDDNVLTVSGERERTQEVKQDRFYRFERRYGSFQRAVGLPQGVNEDQIRADFKDGVLEVHVPKPEEAKPRRIEIAGADEQPTIEGTATPS
jgi:HSP20 family protein